jgi:hypothetical protein
MAMAGIKRHGASGLVIDKNIGLTQEDIRKMFKPRGVVFADLQGNNVDDIRKVVMKPEVNSVNPALPQFYVQLSNLLHMVSLTSDLHRRQRSGCRHQHPRRPAARPRQGRRIQRRRSRVQGCPKGTLGSDHHQARPQAQQTAALVLLRERTPGFYEGQMDRRRGPSRKHQVQGSRRLRIPVNTAEKQMRGRELVEKAGGILPLMQAAAADPRLTSWYTKQYGVELPNLNEEEIHLVCLGRLDEIQQLADSGCSPRPTRSCNRSRAKSYACGKPGTF